MMRLRVATGLLGAAAFVALAAPLAAYARRRGWRVAASVALHRWLCAVLRVRLRRYGEPGPARRLIVSNHVSWLDVLALGANEPMAFLAKKEVGSSAWTRWLVDLQGVVYVDRERRRCIPAVNAEMSRRMASGAPVVLFAEATTSDGTRLLRFRSSHFEAARRAQAYVQPVYLDYRAIGGVSATRGEKPIVAWYGDMAFLPSLWRVLACGGLSCDVHYGEVVAYEPGADRKALARRVELALRELKDRARLAANGGPLPAAPVSR
jgi:1-acyl-sn-glycerol-3-phosphate acyltransferase